MRKPKKPIVHWIIQITVYLFLFTLGLFVIYPVIWIIGSSFNSTDSLGSATAIPQKVVYEMTLEHTDGTIENRTETKKFTGKRDREDFIKLVQSKYVKDGTIIKKENIKKEFDISLRQYGRLFNDTQYLQWYKNTFKIAVINMFLSVVLTVSAAYVFSRFDFKGKKLGLVTILILQVFPSFMGMVAIYNLLAQLKLLNTHLGLILVYAGGQVPYNTWLVKGYLDTISHSLDEAARIDGASHMRTFFTVIMPLARPILVFAALTNFMGPWMDFIFPRLVIRSKEKFTLAIGLFDMISGKQNNQFTMFAAGAVLVAIPITILFMILQKYLTEGLSAGAVKG